MWSPSHNLDEIQVLNSMKLHTSPIFLVHNVEFSFTYNLDEVQNFNIVKLHTLLLLLLQNSVNLSILIIPIFTNAPPS